MVWLRLLVKNEGLSELIPQIISNTFDKELAHVQVLC